MKLGQDYTPQGLLANIAIQCTDPRSGQIGTFLFLGESHKDKDSIISPLCADSWALHRWCKDNGWRSIGNRYIYEP
jgi:hypothetical protein